ncbi:MAG TPA: hypothetical protein VGA55_08845 [Bacteroidota bacterium]
MPTVHFLNSHKSLDVLPGANLREAALKAGIQLYRPLNRVFHANVKLGPIHLPCSSDVVELTDGKGVNPRTPEEERLIGGRFLKRKVGPNHRLACLVQVQGDISLRTTPQLELDIQETKRQAGYLAALGIFILLTALTFAVLALDLIKAL